MISGVHLIIYSKDAESDRAFFRDFLNTQEADAGHGWPIFGLPPAELAVHPSSENDRHEIYMICDHIASFVRQLAKHNIPCSKIRNQSWGRLVQVTLPGGGKLGVYQPRHLRPKPFKGTMIPTVTVSKKKSAKRQLAKR